MTATLTRFIFFASGDLHAIVSSDKSDAEIASHTGPLGSIFVDVPKASYNIALTLRDQMALALPLVVAKDVVVGSAITSKIQAIDVAAVAAAAQVDIVPDIIP